MTQNQTAQRLFVPDGLREPEPIMVLSHGKGQQSTALGYMLHYEEDVRMRYAPGRLLTLTSSTASEHRETDEHVRYLKAFYERIGEHFEEITPDRGYHTANWPSLEHFFSSGERRRIGSKSYPRSCSWQLKLAPFYARLEALLSEEYGFAHGRKKGLYEYVAMTGRRIRVLIGFSAEEAERRKDPDDKVRPFIRNCIERVYPLDELGMTRKDCQEYIRSKGHPAVVPSLCKFCPFKTPFDLFYQSVFEPEDYDRWVQMEAGKLLDWKDDLPPEKNHGVFPGKTLPEVRDEAEEEFGGMTRAEMHERRMAGHGVASRF